MTPTDRADEMAGAAGLSGHTPMMQQSGQERAYVLDLRDRTPARCL